MRSYKVHGIILQRTNFGDADRIVTVFTKEFGKIRVIARGVRKITSRRSSSIESFNHVMLYLHKGKTFDIVTEAQVLDSFQNIKNNLHLIGLAYHICELVDGLCPEHQQHSDVYELLYKTLKQLNDQIIHSFEMELLTRLGFWSDTHDEPISTDAFIEQLLNRKLKSKKNSL